MISTFVYTLPQCLFTLNFSHLDSMSSSKSKSRKEDSGNPDFSLPGIGNYVFQRTVGEGNFAKVKLATHKLTNVEV
jgi:MAP/microtubule affinity-regulating kinase